MAKKLLLINPAQYTKYITDTKLKLSRLRAFAPTGLAYVASLTPSDWYIKIIDETVEPLTFEDADLVGITAMTPTAPRAYQISQQYRRKGIKTVMGGVHASILPDEAVQYADSVLIGEAESVWRDVIHDFERNELKRFYRGERTSLENLVRPRSDLYSDKQRFIGWVQSARGCPNDCDFCSVTAFNGRRYRQRPVEDVLDELEALKSKYVFFSDDNILGYGEKAEERAIQLFQGMVERGLNKRWASQVGIDFASNPEVLKYAQKAGCIGVFIGFESLNEEALQAVHKVRNLKVGVGNYKEIIERIRDHGIGVVGAFLFGSDGDRKDVFQRTAEFILDSKIDATQLTILTPLPGTRLYNRLEQDGRLLRTNYPDDWKHYDFFEAVFRPKHMTPDELMEGATQMFEHTTSRVTSLKRAFNTLIQTKNLPATAIAYLVNRGLGPFWVMRNYEYLKNVLPSGVNDSYLSWPVTEEESYEAELVEDSQESPDVEISTR